MLHDLADKGTLFEYKNSEAAPLRMSLAHWIKQFPAQASVSSPPKHRGESHLSSWNNQ